MKPYLDTVNEVIEFSDIVLYLMDARFPEESRNRDIERIIRNKKKRVIFVFTKYDLVKDKAIRFNKSIKPVVFISAKDFYGIGKLRERIMIEAKRMHIEKPKVGVVSYPNIGKSSLINVLRGRGSARTSNQPGFTKGKQYISVGKILLIDTPGIIPRGEKDDLKHIKLTVKSFNTSESDMDAIKLMEEIPGMVEKYFDVPVIDDKEATLENIARKKNLLKKRGEPDIERVGKMILKLYQDGLL